MTPEELTAFLSEYRNRLTGPIFAHGGTVDKFIGDAIMAVFGTPFQRPDDASRAVACALFTPAAIENEAKTALQYDQYFIAMVTGGHHPIALLY